MGVFPTSVFPDSVFPDSVFPHEAAAGTPVSKTVAVPAEAGGRVAAADLLAFEALGAPPTAAPVLINGYDVRDYGFTLGYLPGTPAIEGHLRASGRELLTVRVEGAPGERVTRRETLSRDLLLRGYLKGAGDDPTLARENWSKVYWIIRQETPTRLEFVDRPDRIYRGEYVGPADVAFYGAPLTQEKLPVTIPFRLTDPRVLEATETTVSGISTTPVDLPQGDEITYPKVRIAGPTGTTIVVDLLDASAAVIASITLQGFPLSGGEFYVIDMAKFTIHENTTGNFGEGTRRLETKTAGDFFAIPANAGNPLTGDPPQARCSSGIAEFVYPRAWAL